MARLAPQISSVTPVVLYEGDPFTVSGSVFGPDDAVEFPTVLVGGVPAGIVSWSDTEIQATVPVGAGNGDIVVVSRGIPSDAYRVTVRLPAPTLTDIGTATN